MHSSTNNQLHNGKPDKAKPGREAAYSQKQLRQAVHAYHDRFNETVPLGLITRAASAFRSSELMSTLLDRVIVNDPVQNWESFSGEFFYGS
jgi:hypothetical protein